MVYGIEHNRQIQKGEGCDRSSNYNEKIILNIQEGTFSGMIFFL